MAFVTFESFGFCYRFWFMDNNSTPSLRRIIDAEQSCEAAESNHARDAECSRTEQSWLRPLHDVCRHCSSCRCELQRYGISSSSLLFFTALMNGPVQWPDVHIFV